MSNAMGTQGFGSQASQSIIQAQAVLHSQIHRPDPGRPLGRRLVLPVLRRLALASGVLDLVLADLVASEGTLDVGLHSFKSTALAVGRVGGAHVADRLFL